MITRQREDHDLDRTIGFNFDTVRDIIIICADQLPNTKSFNILDLEHYLRKAIPITQRIDPKVFDLYSYLVNN